MEGKYKSRCLQKIKLVNWGANHVFGGSGPPGSPLAPALIGRKKIFWDVEAQIDEKYLKNAKAVCYLYNGKNIWFGELNLR